MNTTENTAPRYGQDPTLVEIDAALEADSAKHKKEPENAEEGGDEVERDRLSLLSRYLRLAGAIVIIASAATFMCQHWQGAEHVSRYFMFLAFTVVTSMAGIFCGLKIKDDKGARTFLAVSAAIIPVHFCQSGALLFYRFGKPLFGESLATYQKMFEWKAPGPYQTVMMTIAGILVLLPVIYVSFSALARAKAKLLTGLYAVSNLFLLIPTREANNVALLAIALFGGLLCLELKYSKKQSLLQTREGILVRLMLAAPFVLLIARNMYLYEVTIPFFSMLFAVMALFMYVFVPMYLQSKTKVALSQNIGISLGGISWFLFVGDIIDALNLHIEKDPVILLIGLPLAIGLIAVSRFSKTGGRGLRKKGAFLATATVVYQMIMLPVLLSSVFCVLITILTSAYGYILREKGVFLFGAGGFILGIAYHLRWAAELASYSPWVSLAIIGIGTVLLAAYIEKNHAVVAKWVQTIRNDVKSWN